MNFKEPMCKGELWEQCAQKASVFASRELIFFLYAPPCSSDGNSSSFKCNESQESLH